jgi:hypothetical protein
VLKLTLTLMVIAEGHGAATISKFRDASKLGTAPVGAVREPPEIRALLEAPLRRHPSS